MAGSGGGWPDFCLACGANTSALRLEAVEPPAGSGIWVEGGLGWRLSVPTHILEGDTARFAWNCGQQADGKGIGKVDGPKAQASRLTVTTTFKAPLERPRGEETGLVQSHGASINALTVLGYEGTAKSGYDPTGHRCEWQLDGRRS